jgi:mevalonate kinase
VTAESACVATSHGKIILLGEHAVVYGVPAIAAGLDKGARAEARATSRSSLTLGERKLELPATRAALESDEALAFRALLESLSAPPTSVSIQLDIAPGVGLGASAAIAVACAKAVYELVHPGAPLDESAVVKAAKAWESVFHGAPSGIDAAAAYFGGCFRFTKADGPRPLKLGAPLVVAVALAGPAASTRVMVDQVRRLRDQKRELFDKTLAGIESLVENAVHAIEAGDARGLGELLNYGQMLLSGLFLSTPEIEQAVSVARSAGALGAKLTGAGGGGAVIALSEPGESGRILDAWRAAGIDGFATTVA